MRTLTSLSAALAVAVLLASGRPVSAEEQPLFLDSLIAIVGQDAITFLDVTAHTRFQDRFQHNLIMTSELPDKDAALREALGRNRALARQRLVDEEVIYADFKAKGFKLPPEVIRREYDQRVSEQANGNYDKFEQLLASMGMTREEFTERLTRQVAVQIYVAQFITRRIIIRPAAVQEYYEANRESFRKPAEIRLQSIRLEPGKDNDQAFRIRVASVANALPGASDFVSLDRSAQAGLGPLNAADLGWMKVASLDSAMTATLDPIRNGRIAGPIELDGNVIFYRIVESRGGDVEPLETVREQIHDLLFRQERQTRFEALLVDLRQRYYVRYVQD